MGIIKLSKEKEQKYARIPADDVLSLHINLGLPHEIERSHLQLYKNDFYYISDIITLAFVSPNRIDKRKTRTSLMWEKTAYKTKKHKETPTADDYINDLKYSNYARLELRTTEFKDYPSYRLLVETQRLAAMLFAYIKMKENIPCPNWEKYLASLWSKFRLEIITYFNEIGLDCNLADEKPAELIKLMENSDFKKQCRKIINKYSRLVASV